MKKIFLWFILSLTLLFPLIFSACGNKNSNPTAPSGPSYSPTSTPTPTSIYGCQFPSTLGNVAGSSSGYPAGYINAESYNLTQAGVVSYLTIQLASATGQIQMAVYSDVSSAPGSLLGQTNPQTAVNGNNSLALTSFLSLQPGVYWIAFQTQNSTTANYNSGGGTVVSRIYSYGSFPSSLPSTGWTLSSDQLAMAEIYCLSTPTFTPTFTSTNTFTPTATFTPTSTFTAVYPLNTQWGSSGTSNGQFHYPAGIAVDGSGNVYIADNLNNRLQKFTSVGGYLAQWGSSAPATGNGNGQFNTPDGVAVNSAGTTIYVADSGNNRIQAFTSTGSYLTQWGASGSGNGQFNFPSGLTTDSSGNVYVTDRGNNRIQMFDYAGNYLNQVGSYGSGNGQFYGPEDVAVDSGGNVYITDFGNNRVQKLNSSLTYLTQWGSYGTSNGLFSNPVGILVDGAGNILVADGGNSRIQKFTSTGVYLTQWSVSNVFRLAVDGNGYVYATLYFLNEVDKFAPF